MAIAKSNSSSNHTSWLYWLFGLAVMAAVILLATHFSDQEEFALMLRRAQPFWLFIGAGLQILTYVSDAKIWQSVLAKHHHSLSLWQFIQLGLSKLFIDQALPSGGLSGTLLIVGSLIRRGIPRSIVMATVVLGLSSFYLAFFLAIITAMIIIWGLGLLTPVFIIPAGLFALLSAVILGTLFSLHLGQFKKYPRLIRKIKFIQRLADAVESASKDLTSDRKLLLKCTALQLCIFFLDATTVWSMVRAVGTDISPIRVFASYMVSALARTLGIMPGGLGTFEAVSVGTLHLMGVPVAAALAATLLFRGYSFWLPMLPGLYFARQHSKR